MITLPALPFRFGQPNANNGVVKGCCTDSFTQAPKAQSNHVRPRLPFEALEELNDKEKGKDGGKEYIGTKVGVVTVNGSLNGALWANGSAILIGVGVVGAIRRHDLVVLKTR